MKKLSVSLFALLAIVVAVSSAFTTQKKAKVFSTAWFEVSGQHPLTTYDNTSGTGSFKVLSTYVDRLPRTQSYFFDNEICSELADNYVCAAQIEYGVDSDLDQADLDVISVPTNIIYKED